MGLSGLLGGYCVDRIQWIVRVDAIEEICGVARIDAVHGVEGMLGIHGVDGVQRIIRPILVDRIEDTDSSLTQPSTLGHPLKGPHGVHY